MTRSKISKKQQRERSKSGSLMLYIASSYSTKDFPLRTWIHGATTMRIILQWRYASECSNSERVTGTHSDENKAVFMFTQRNAKLPLKTRQQWSSLKLWQDMQFCSTEIPRFFVPERWICCFYSNWFNLIFTASWENCSSGQEVMC